ncbi:MAG: hypothetical protein IPM59_10360 [Chloracidobacterium sp.]|nr:hypothetical protein [Chloracidobacterium sp.]
MPTTLALVKSTSQLQQEQRHWDEISLDAYGLAVVRGAITEVSGGPSTGKVSVALSLLAKLTAEGEVCAAVDACGGFDPTTAVLAGVELQNLLWIRCGGDVERAFMAADHLVQAKGFGAIWLNLNGLSERTLRMVPKSYWFRYRTRIKETPTILLVTAAEHLTGSASQRSFTATRTNTLWSGTGNFKLLRELHLDLYSRNEIGCPLTTRIEMDYSEV